MQAISANEGVTAVASRIKDRAICLLSEQSRLRDAATCLYNTEVKASEERKKKESQHYNLISTEESKLAFELEVLDLQDKIVTLYAKQQTIRRLRNRKRRSTQQLKTTWLKHVESFFAPESLKINLFQKSLHKNILGFESTSMRQSSRLRRFIAQKKNLRNNRRVVAGKCAGLKESIKQLKYAIFTADDEIIHISHCVRSTLEQRARLRRIIKNVREG